jgi:hypothetical protein
MSHCSRRAQVPLPSVLGDTFMDAIANGDGHKDRAAIARRGEAGRAGLGWAGLG